MHCRQGAASRPAWLEGDRRWERPGTWEQALLPDSFQKLSSLSQGWSTGLCCNDPPGCRDPRILALATTAKRWKQPKGPSMDKLTNKMRYTHNGMLFSLKKKCSSDTCYTMDGP